MSQTLGIMDITWRGQKLDIEKGGKLKLGGMKNTPVMTGRKVHRAEEFEAGEATVTTVLARGRRILDLWGSTREGELIVVCDTGQTYAVPDAFLTNRPEMTGGEGGKIEMKWAFGEVEEMIDG